ncbi:MAG: glycosyltransferase family 2 protein [Bacilli bacterium]|nr:glycosyltransferase family 2 protein [Clostridia bacterium]MBR4618123.1 glycosyltransferase family 2 protein [Bacilli bacterium]
MLPLVSVVIPVYNVEAYLCQCLDSIISQTLKDIEIICVDDGSTDNSLNILKEYAAKDKRITIITQKNLYAGTARNAGLKIAKSDYIMFLDSDDFFELNMLENMYNKIIEDNSDVVICRYYIYDDQSNKIIGKNNINKTFINNSPFSINTFKNDLFTINPPNPWTKLFKKQLFIENNLQFENYKCCNDLTCICMALALSKKITVVDDIYIYYRANQLGNLTANRGNDYISFILAIHQLENNLKKFKLYEKFYVTFLNRVKGSMKWELSIRNKEQRIKMIKFAKDILSKELYDILYKIGQNI